MKEEMRLSDLLKALKNQWLTVLVTSGVAVGSALCITQFMLPPVYSTTTQIILVPEEETAMNTKPLLQSYIDMLNGDAVIGSVKKNLKLEQSVEDLKKQITTVHHEDSQLIQLEVEANSPKSARQLASEVAQVSLEKMAQYMKVTNLQVVDGGEEHVEKLFPKPLFVGSISLAAGLLGGGGLAVLQEQRRERKHLRRRARY